MKQVVVIVLLLFCLPVSLFAQEDVPLIRKSFVIITATRSYSDALRSAKRAVAKLGFPLNLRGLHPHKRTGLTLTRADADSNGWEYPINYPRGRYDDGKYISIEYSSGYDEWKPKQFLVMVWSGNALDPERKKILNDVKKIFTSVELRSANIYMGCMH